jgi:ketosteroid isomerase-like protein
VRTKIKNIFEEINSGNSQSMVDSLASEFEYRFIGNSPLGGRRTTKVSMKKWWSRLFKLFPGLKFQLNEIVVQGYPWNTKIMTHMIFRAKIPSLNGSEYELYENEVMQSMTLRWGRITSIVTVEDTQKFVSILPILAGLGIIEASEAPIND